jgi:small-conductance mechanosensitive channel
MTRGDWYLLAALVVLLVVIFIVDRIVARAGRRWIERLPPGDQAMLTTRYRLLRRIAVALTVFVGVLVVLLANDGTRAVAQAVLASSAVVGLVVGFAARSTLANFIAGIMIAINQPVRLGDRVSVADAEGVVEDIGLAYTRLRTAENRRILIPNEELANSRVTNHTLIDPVSLAQARIVVPVAADPARVKEVLAQQVAAAPGRLADRPGPGVAVADVTAEGAVYTASAWVADPAQAAQTGAWLRERCLAALNEDGALAEAIAAEDVAG